MFEKRPQDWIIELSLRYLFDSEDRNVIFIQWVLGAVADTIFAIERFRVCAGAPNTEFVLEVEFSVVGVGTKVSGYQRRGGHARRLIGTLEPGVHNLLRYSVGPTEEFPDLAGFIERDFVNYLGREFQGDVVVDFEAPLAELHQRNGN